jgi:hypothetical protein
MAMIILTVFGVLVSTVAFRRVFLPWQEIEAGMEEAYRSFAREMSAY